MLPERPDWMTRANCAGLEPGLMFPEQGDTTAWEQAKLVCAGCVVRSECLEYALANGERFGVWGGTSERERRAIRRERRLNPPTPPPNPKIAQAAELRRHGFSVAEVAAELDVSEPTVKRWTAGEKFTRVAGEAPWCSHCDAERAGRHGLCQPCRRYLQKYRRLPDQGVLVRREIRKDERRQTGAA